jgi:hypothetical protein
MNNWECIKILRSERVYEEMNITDLISIMKKIKIIIERLTIAIKKLTQKSK